MLPPSDSDEDSEDEAVPVKTKQVTVNQVNTYDPPESFAQCFLLSLTIRVQRSRLRLACCPLATQKTSQAQRRRKTKSPKQPQLANLLALQLHLQLKSMPRIFICNTRPGDC